jgi:hypothetical protein
VNGVIQNQMNKEIPRQVQKEDHEHNEQGQGESGFDVRRAGAARFSAFAPQGANKPNYSELFAHPQNLYPLPIL